MGERVGLGDLPGGTVTVDMEAIKAVRMGAVGDSQVEMAAEVRGVRYPSRGQVFGEGLLPQNWSPFPAHP